MVLVPRNTPKVSFGVRGPPDRPPDTPGPGHYGDARSAPAAPPRGETQIFARNGAAVFGTCQSRGYYPKAGPGPGAYGSKDLAKGPSYSCTHRKQATVWDAPRSEGEAPGPGAYGEKLDLGNSTLPEGPKFSIGQPYRSKVEDLPGPGHYGSVGQQHASGRYSARKQKRGFGFGTSVREPGVSHRMPGPGQYSPPLTTLSGPKHSMAPRRINAAPDSAAFPGPGAHEHHGELGEGWGHITIPSPSGMSSPGGLRTPRGGNPAISQDC